MKTGLVLEGGAMRGMFTAGILDVLMEHNIEVDGVIGVSAGATFGCNYKSKQIGRTIRYNMNYCNDPRYCSFRSLLTTGDLYGAEFCYHTLPEQLDLFDNETLEYIRREEQKGSVLVLCPKEKLPIDRIEHHPERLKAVYDIGRETALEHLKEIKTFLQT